MKRPLLALTLLFALPRTAFADGKLDRFLGLLPGTARVSWMGVQPLVLGTDDAFHPSSRYTLRRQYAALSPLGGSCRDAAHPQRVQEAYEATRGGRYDAVFSAKYYCILQFQKARQADLDAYAPGADAEEYDMDNLFVVTRVHRREYYGDARLEYGCEDRYAFLAYYDTETGAWSTFEDKPLPFAVHFDERTISYEP